MLTSMHMSDQKAIMTHNELPKKRMYRIGYPFPPICKVAESSADPICIALLCIVWILAAVIVNPRGDFPLNDDWAYGPAVRILLEEGDLRFSDWTAPNLIAQVLWGAMFCLPTGFSFTTLRVSTLVLGLIGVVATYGLLRESRAREGLSLFGALVLAFNPIYFSLSFTFMSDVPFVAVAAASSWLYMRGLRRGSQLHIAGGLFLAGAAILIRQVGLALVLAFAPAYLVRYGLSIRRLIGAVVMVAGGIALQNGYEAWLRKSGRLPANFGAQIDILQTQLYHGSPSFFSDAVTITFYSLAYLGVFLFSLLVVTQWPALCRRSPAPLIVLIGIAAIIMAMLLASAKSMPFYHNIIHKGGLGCCEEDPSKAPQFFWSLVTFFSILGAFLLLLGLLRSFVITVLPETNPQDRSLLIFGLLSTATAFAPLPMLGLGFHGFYDRYLIAFLPWLMLVLVANSQALKHSDGSRVAKITGAVTLCLLSMFTIAATHDYLSANRARWVALNRLLNEYRVNPEDIDGGFEFNGFYLYNIPHAHHPEYCCNWFVTRDYLVTYSPKPEYKVLEKIHVPQWLPWRRSEILIQAKVPH
jgi:Dolichyl-phosphate-mannose-protein mannosyltransferase